MYIFSSFKYISQLACARLPPLSLFLTLLPSFFILDPLNAFFLTSFEWKDMKLKLYKSVPGKGSQIFGEASGLVKLSELAKLKEM